ncbi:MAG: RDD family protein, partial [Candidatus Dormibacteria bacterium]
MSTPSWQIPCPRCGWANSGALTKCAKCGQPLGSRPGMLVAGKTLSRPDERIVTSRVAKPGGFIPRLTALVIDTIILVVVILPLYALWASQLAAIQVKQTGDISGQLLQRQASFQIAVLALLVFYFAGSWAMMGGTPGQLLLSLRVTNARAEGIGFFRALLRLVALLIFGPFNAVFLVLKQKRGLHDTLAGTYVIQIVDRSDLGANAAGLPPSSPAAVAARAEKAPLAVPGPDPGREPAPTPPHVPDPAPAAARPMYSPPAAPAEDYAPPAALDMQPPDDVSLYSPPPIFAPVQPAGPPADASPPAGREIYSPPPTPLVSDGTEQEPPP